ncbi:MAG: hypothetical protein M1821_003312 [Bathelium mastoideum]|nr:MAG: hypothetical protein M1821_003312 [Bathelium mastoideum]
MSGTTEPENASSSWLGLAANCLGLIRAIADTTVNGNNLNSAARIFFQWLTNERISEQDYEMVAGRTSHLLSVNNSGLEMLEKIKRPSLKKSSLAGIPVAIAGSVGRAMACASTHSYMVTTVASLLPHHDIQFVAQTITNTVFEEAERAHGTAQTYNVSKAYLGSIMNKMVSSIALNVVNAGYSVRNLPDEIQKIYQGDVMNAETLAATIVAIEKNTNEILLDCSALFGDLVNWILSHFEGVLQVSINGVNIYRETLGSKNIKLLIMVRNLVSDSVPYVRISVKIEGILETVLEEFPDKFSWEGTKAARPSTRLPLYTVSQSLNRTRTSHAALPTFSEMTLNKNEYLSIEYAAQEIGKWLLRRPLSIEDDETTQLEFAVSLSGSGEFTLADALCRYPGLTRLAGKQDDNLVTFRPPPPESGVDKRKSLGRGLKSLFDEQGQSERHVQEDSGIRLVVECFPLLHDALTRCQKRCDCPNCVDNGAIGDGKPGCLRENGVNIFFNLLGHSIAEGFGAVDVSGLLPEHTVRRGVENILMQLIQEQRIIWDTWFALAASIYLGCPWPMDKKSCTQGAKELVAVQYGSVVIAAIWADPTVPLRKKNVLGFVQAEGHLRGLNDEYAVVQIEATTTLRNENGSEEGSPSWLEPLDEIPDIPLERFREDVSRDLASPKLTHWIINSEGVCSRLLIVVQTPGFDRIINPAQALLSFFKSIHVKCEHSNGARNTAMVIKGTATTWTFERIVSEWTSSNSPLGLPETHRRKESGGLATIYVSSTMDTELKFNVVAALSPFGVVMRDPTQACLTCAMQSRESFAVHAFRIVNKECNRNQLALWH